MPDLKTMIRREVYAAGYGVVTAVALDAVEVNDDEMRVEASVRLEPVAGEIVVNITKVLR